jgi:hypothetical protein
VAKYVFGVPGVLYGPADECGRVAFVAMRPAPPAVAETQEDDEVESMSPFGFALAGILIGFFAAFVLSELGRARRAAAKLDQQSNPTSRRTPTP